MNGNVPRLEQYRSVATDARLHQIPNDFMLCIERDCASPGQLRQRDSMSRSAEPQLDAAMQRSFTQHAIADTAFAQQIDGTLFEHAGPERRLDVRTAARLEHDRIDAFQMQQMRQCRDPRVPRR